MSLLERSDTTVQRLTDAVLEKLDDATALEIKGEFSAQASEATRVREQAATQVDEARAALADAESRAERALEDERTALQLASWIDRRLRGSGALASAGRAHRQRPVNGSPSISGNGTPAARRATRDLATRFPTGPHRGGPRHRRANYGRITLAVAAGDRQQSEIAKTLDLKVTAVGEAARALRDMGILERPHHDARHELTEQGWTYVRELLAEAEEAGLMA